MRPTVSCAPCAAGLHEAIGLALVSPVPAIFAPLPDIAVRLIKPPRIGLEALHGHGLFKVPALRTPPRIYVIAIVVCLLRRDGRAPAERGIRPSAAAIFPFGLTQQAIGLTCNFAVKPADVSSGIVPVHTHNRMAVILRKPWIAPGLRRIELPVSIRSRLSAAFDLVARGRDEGRRTARESRRSGRRQKASGS